MPDTFADLTVSLEPQLIDVLRPLHPRLPTELASTLQPYITPPSSSTSDANTPTIPYAQLLSLSKWTRTPPGLRALNTPPALDPSSYTMLALLAGTRTSPDRRFPSPSPSHALHNDPAREAKKEMGDKRAIVTVVNGMLSVLGAGAATFVAAQRTGWRDEWKILVAFLAAAAVAFSEVALFIIHDSRRSTTTSRSHSMIRAPSYLTTTINDDAALIPPMTPTSHADMTGTRGARQSPSPPTRRAQHEDIIKTKSKHADPDMGTDSPGENSAGPMIPFLSPSPFSPASPPSAISASALAGGEVLRRRAGARASQGRGRG